MHNDTLTEVAALRGLIVRYDVSERIYTEAFVRDIVLAFRVCSKYVAPVFKSVLHTGHVAVVGLRLYSTSQYFVLLVFADREEVSASEFPIQEAACPTPKTTHGYIPVAAGSMISPLVEIDTAHVQ